MIHERFYGNRRATRCSQRATGAQAAQAKLGAKKANHLRISPAATYSIKRKRATGSSKAWYGGMIDGSGQHTTSR
jgi:hypothetical protein